jgi:histone deacetylase 1/2
MKMHYELTTQPRLGPAPQDGKEAVVLNRIIRWCDHGLEYEADPRQVEKLLAECGLTGANAVATPGVRLSFSEVEKDDELQPFQVTAFRGAAARANYLAADRIDCQFAAKEICRWMSSPTENSWNALKRLCRYLAGLPRLVYTYGWQDVDAVDVYTDTDWAGCPRTRKSTSGGCVMLGKHTIKTWSATQSSVSLSSGEAEFNGVVRGAGMGLGFQSLMRDLGQDAPVRVWTDSEAAIGISSRQGLGKLRHLDTHTLWIQHAVRSGRIDLRKVLGEANPADIFTKHSLSRERLKMLT